MLCIECQNGVIGAESVLPSLESDSTDLVPAIRRLLDGARDAGARVVHATYEGPLGGSPSGTARLWRLLGPATSGWSPGDEETQVVDGLLRDGDLVLPRHHGLFPTSGTELLPILRGLGITTIVLAGVSLNLALPHTAGDASQAGFSVVVPRDAVAGTPTSYADQVLDNTIAMVAQVTTVDAVLDHWSAA